MRNQLPAPPPLLSPSSARMHRDASIDVLDLLYRRLRVLGEGTYGIVYEALHKPSGFKVALKKIRTEESEELMASSGLPMTAIRETVLLKEFHHPNIVRLLEVNHIGAQLWLSFELCDTDLRQYMKQKLMENKKAPDYRSKKKDRTRPFLPLEQCKLLAQQLLNAVAYCHSRRIIHRDLKPQNLLLDQTGTKLKVADFGLARTFTTPTEPNTHEVVTLWYRAPELLLGDPHYTSALDVWSIGCIIAEMVTGVPIFHGDSEIDTLFRMFRILGTPVEPVPNAYDKNVINGTQSKSNKANSLNSNHRSTPPITKAKSLHDVESTKDFAYWEGVSKFRYYQDTFPMWKRNPIESLEQALPSADLGLLDLLRRVFEYDPDRRPTALEVLQHPWVSQLL